MNVTAFRPGGRGLRDARGGQERAERALLLIQERRSPVARKIGRPLLEHRDGIVLDSCAEYWLGEIGETIGDRDDPAKRAQFTGWVESLVRAVHGHARLCNQPSTTPEEARRALALATEFTFQERPMIPEQVPRSSPGTWSDESRRSRGGQTAR